MKKFMSAVKSFMVREEEGASMVEYGLLVALIAVVCLGAVTTLGGGISSMFNSLAVAIPGTGA